MEAINGRRRYGARMDDIQATDDVTAPPLPDPAPEPQRRRRVAALVLAGSILVPLVLGGIVWYALTATTSLEDAREDCAPGSPYALIGDGGDSLTLRSLGKERPGLTVIQLRCFMTELEVTDAITSEINTTRALDGRQSADWDDYHGSWTYHPSTGLQMVITEG